MAVKSLATLRSDIIAAIATNTTGAITGDILQTALVDTLDSLNALDAAAASDAEVLAGSVTGPRIPSPAQLKLASSAWVHDPSIIYFHDDLLRTNSTYVHNTASGTGAGVNFYMMSNGGYTGCHGVSELTTGTTSSGYAAMFGALQYGWSSWTFFNRAALSFYECSVVFVTPSAASDATDSYFIVVGSPSDAVWSAGVSFGIRYTHSSNSGNWECYCKDSAETTSDSGVAFVPSTLYTLKCVYSGGVMKFYLNGTKIGADISTNIPGRMLGPGATIKKTLGTTARILAVDAIKCFAKANNRF